MFKDSIKSKEVELKQWKQDAKRFHENIFGQKPPQTKKDMCKPEESVDLAANKEGPSMAHPVKRGTEPRAVDAQTSAQMMSQDPSLKTRKDMPRRDPSF